MDKAVYTIIILIAMWAYSLNESIQIKNSKEEILNKIEESCALTNSIERDR